MAADPLTPHEGDDPTALFPALAAADPAGRAARVLRLIEANGSGAIALAARDGVRATLDSVSLGREHLRTHVAALGRVPAWWNEERQALDLRHADLRGASLRHADLRGALLEEANLAGADLAGANLHGAHLGGAELHGALLEDADLRHAVLRFARGRESVWEEARLPGADLWGAAMERADLSGADLQGATLEEADFRSTDLAGADLRGANLKRARLAGADLRGADLRGAAVGDTDFQGALLRDANLEDLDLTACALTGAHTAGARLEKTRLYREQLGGAIGEEQAREYGLARRGYLVLERNFEELGDHDAARWAYARRRRMEKREAGQKAAAALRAGRWGAALRPALKAAADQLVEWVCDYGESVPRVLAALVVVYLLFIPLYGLTGTVRKVHKTPDGEVRETTRELGDLALFSLTAMTAPGNPPEYLVPANALGYWLPGAQTLLSIFLTGLMGFVAGNRIRR